MKLCRFAALGAVACAVFTVTDPAPAAIYTLTGMGHIRSGAHYDIHDRFDLPGLFGAAGADLAGKAFTVVFTIDTGEPWLVVPPDPGGHTTVYRSGINPYGQRGEAITAAVTIGGVTISDIGRSVDGAAMMTGIGSEQQLSATNGYSTNGVLQAYDMVQLNAGHSGNYPGLPFSTRGQTFSGGSLRTNISIGSGLGIVGDSLFPQPFSIDLKEFNSNGMFSFGGYRDGQNQSFDAYFRLDHATFVAAAVPEPATWATMLSGFALIGGALRRRIRSIPANATIS